MKEENKLPLIIRDKEINLGLLITNCTIHGDVLILNSIIDGEIRVGASIVNFSRKPKHTLEVQTMKIKDARIKVSKLLGGINEKK